MPKVNPERTLNVERNLAQRIAFEREARGMKQAGLALRMKQLGHPMQGSTVYKIESGDPPRRVTVDELVGFAAVFDISVEELLIPVELVYDREARQILSGMSEAQANLLRAIDAVMGYMVVLKRLPPDRPSTDKLVEMLSQGNAHDPYVNAHTAETGEVTFAGRKLTQAFQSLIAAMDVQAQDMLDRKEAENG